MISYCFPGQLGHDAHLTHAKAAMKQYYHSSGLIDAVANYYKRDYALFGIGPPPI